MERFERNFPREEETIEQEKPEILYHASPRRDIEDLEPRAETVRNSEEGPVVFASPDAAEVTRMLVPVNDAWTQLSTFDGVHTIIISDKDRFNELDKGGAVYSLPSTTFQRDSEKHKREWTSKSSVKPTGRKEYESGFEAMLENKVQVYFVDEQTLENIRFSDDHGLSILRGLHSENEKLGKNFIALPTDNEGS